VPTLVAPPPWCDSLGAPASKAEVPLRGPGWAWEADWAVEVRQGDGAGQQAAGSGQTDGGGWEYAVRFDQPHWSDSPRVRQKKVVGLRKRQLSPPPPLRLRIATRHSLAHRLRIVRTQPCTSPAATRMPRINSPQWPGGASAQMWLPPEIACGVASAYHRPSPGPHPRSSFHSPRSTHTHTRIHATACVPATPPPTPTYSHSPFPPPQVKAVRRRVWTRIQLPLRRDQPLDARLRQGGAAAAMVGLRTAVSSRAAPAAPPAISASRKTSARACGRGGVGGSAGGGLWGGRVLGRGGDAAARAPLLGGAAGVGVTAGVMVSAGVRVPPGDASDSSEDEEADATPPWLVGRPEAEGELEDIFSEASKPFERCAGGASRHPILGEGGT
jgi:hypothetical protein